MEPKKSNEPAVKAREALDLLFRQARGLPELLPRSYTTNPVERSYEPVEGGDPDAIQEYAWLVCKHVENLNSLVRLHAKNLRPISERRFNWPILKSLHPQFSDDENQILTTLRVGRKSGRNLDRHSKWSPHGKIPQFVDELLWWADHCRQNPASNNGRAIIIPTSVYDRYETPPFVSMLRAHLEPREAEAARLDVLSKDCIEEWRGFMGALLTDCFNDRHCAKFLSDALVKAKSRKQKHGYSRARTHLLPKVLRRLNALAGVK